MLLARAEDLNYDEHDSIKVRRFNKVYDMTKISEYITIHKKDIETDMNEAFQFNNIERAIEIFDNNIVTMHRNAKVKTRTITSDTHAISMKNAYDSFDNYLACLQNGTIIEKEQALQLYVRNRKKVTREIMLSEHKRSGMNGHLILASYGEKSSGKVEYSMHQIYIQQSVSYKITSKVSTRRVNIKIP